MLSTYRNFYDKRQADVLVLKALEKLNNNATVEDIARIIDRKKRTVMTYLKRLKLQSKIKSSETKPYFYTLIR
jgi:predicted transcriptional regulator